MPKPRKSERNKQLVKLKNKGWSFRQLADHFNIDVRAAWEIYQRDKDVEVIHRNKKKVLDSVEV